MFGSVTAQEISDLLKAKGIEVDRRKIQIQEPIKKAGEFAIPVKLHLEVTGQIKLVVEGEKVEEKAETKEKKEAPKKPQEKK